MFDPFEEAEKAGVSGYLTNVYMYMYTCTYMYALWSVWVVIMCLKGSVQVFCVKANEHVSIIPVYWLSDSFMSLVLWYAFIWVHLFIMLRCIGSLFVLVHVHVRFSPASWAPSVVRMEVPWVWIIPEARPMFSFKNERLTWVVLRSFVFLLCYLERVVIPNYMYMY